MIKYVARTLMVGLGTFTIALLFLAGDATQRQANAFSGCFFHTISGEQYCRVLFDDGHWGFWPVGR